MNVKLTGLVLGTALSALAFTACETAPNTNTNKGNTTVSNNTAVVTNNNANVVNSGNGTTTVSDKGNSSIWSNTNGVTREQYDKDRAKYEAEKGTSTIGQGANDSWLWFKTRSALLATNDLRESTINVDVNNDMITLKGTVANDAQKKKAEEVAKGIDGNKGVKNELQVKPGDSMTNQVMTDDKSKSNTKSNSNK